jgi:hypothetical protein
MPDYERSTRATTLAALPEPIQAALLARASASQLTIDDDAPAYVTHSRRLRKPGLFARLTGTADKDAEHQTAFVIAPKDLLVATHGERRGTAVLNARLEDVDVASLAARLNAMGVELDDDGVTVTGFPVSVEGVTSRGSYFIGLGPPEGVTARAALTEAVRQAKA